METGIRILSIQAQNIKNLKNGEIIFESDKKVNNNDFAFSNSDIVGVYGPNGTSKTALINAVNILKKLFSSANFSNDLYHYVSIGSDSMKLSIRVLFNLNNIKSIYEYNVTFKVKDEDVFIANENLNVKKYDEQLKKFSKQSCAISVDFEDNNPKSFIGTDEIYKAVTDNDFNKIGKLLTLKGMMYQAKKSFIFSREFYKYLHDNNKIEETCLFIASMIVYSYYYVNVFDNKTISKIAANDYIPFVYIEDDIDNIGKLEGTLSLFDDGVLLSKYLNQVNKYIKQINSVALTIIPNFALKLNKLSESVNANNEPIIKYCLMSKKENFDIPLRYESDGIKKIISMLSSFILSFNCSGSFLAIDEFDSGIFEYLLGVLLTVFKEDGKGQLLFTSHNLRALEVIKNNILFTTNDDTNRFQTMKYVGESNNLRMKYIKENYLDNELFSSHIDANNISNVLLKARIK